MSADEPPAVAPLVGCSILSEEPVPDHVFDHCFLASVQFIDQTMLYGQAVLSVTVREQGWLQRLASPQETTWILCLYFSASCGAP